jgi:hypothetical protein
LVSLPSINVLVYGFKKRVTVRERGDWRHKYIETNGKRNKKD